MDKPVDKDLLENELARIPGTNANLRAEIASLRRELLETRRELALTEDECLDQQRRADHLQSLLAEELTKPVEYGNFTA